MKEKIYRTEVLLPFKSYDDINKILSNPMEFKEPITLYSTFLNGVECEVSFGKYTPAFDLLFMLNVNLKGTPIHEGTIKRKYTIQGINGLINIFKIESNRVCYLINIDIKAPLIMENILSKINLIEDKLNTDMINIDDYINKLIKYSDLSNEYHLLQLIAGNLYYCYHHPRSKPFNQYYIDELYEKLTYYGYDVKDNVSKSKSFDDKMEEMIQFIYHSIGVKKYINFEGLTEEDLMKNVISNQINEYLMFREEVMGEPLFY